MKKPSQNYETAFCMVLIFTKVIFQILNLRSGFYATFFLKLCANACNPNSISTFLRDFKVNRLK